MCRELYTERAIPPNVKLVVSHLHDGNSSRSDRRGHKYATIAKLYNRETGHFVAAGIAYCSKRDVPSRKTGRVVAIGRALKNFWNPEGLSDPPF